MSDLPLDWWFGHCDWWFEDNGAVGGTPFDGDRILSHEEAVRAARTALSGGSFAQLIAGWNGFFAIAVRDHDKIALAVDRSRSIPLFFAQIDEKVVVSDSALWLRERAGSPSLDSVRVAQYLTGGYVLNGATLCREIQQVQAGEIVILTKTHPASAHNIERKRYRVFSPRGDKPVPDKDLFAEYEQVLDRCFTRALQVAGGRQIVVPLSGGYDSRLMLLMLIRNGAKNLFTYSYGGDKNETGPSRYVAEAAGVPWHLCDYSPAAWRRAGHEPSFNDYLLRAGNLSSVAHVQDWLAIKELKQNGLVSKDAVFMPGYAADLPAGSFLTHQWWEGRFPASDSVAFAQHIWLSHYCRRDRGHNGVLKAEVLACLAESTAVARGSRDSVKGFDTWMLSEWVPKYIVNALRAVDIEGYSWWMPFFDEEFLSFWEGVPDEFRLGERLHREYTDKLFLRITGAEPPRLPARCKYDVPPRPGPSLRIREITQALYWSKPMTAVRRFRQGRLVRRAYAGDPVGWFGLFSEEEFIRRSRQGTTDIIGLLAERSIDLLAGRIASSYSDAAPIAQMMGWSRTDDR
jgi:asparagine synthase (glutamine-hydrolysing)